MLKRADYIFQHRYAKFAIGGIIVFLFEWMLTIMLTELFYFDYKLSYIFSLGIGLLLLFSFHEKITFRIQGQERKKMLKRFLLVYLLIMGINWVFVSWASVVISYIIAIPLVCMMLSMLLYPLNKHFVFGIKE